MRVPMLLVVAAATAAATPAAGAPGSAAAASRASLRVLDRTPMTVRGTGFVPNERVGVRLAARGRAWTRRSAAGGTGTIIVRFAVSLGRCERFSLQAFGSEGSRVRLYPTASRPDCVSSDSGTS